MKCELCHNAEAETAIRREGDEELYVCRECAKLDRQNRQKRAQRTRKISGLPPGVSMSVTEISGGEAPPIIGALMNAFQDMVSDIEKARKETSRAEGEKLVELPLTRLDAPYRVREFMHLEGLHLIGELEATKRALVALKMDLKGVDADGVKATGHVYRFMYSGGVERAKRVVGDILREERNARIRLKEEMPRVFEDAICRSLAITKNCRLLTPGEFFDLLSPLRLAALEGMLEGISLEEIDRLQGEADISGSEDKLAQEERDRIDAERADEINRLFEEVVLK